MELNYILMILFLGIPKSVSNCSTSRTPIIYIAEAASVLLAPTIL